jgi:hypothetical protein
MSAVWGTKGGNMPHELSEIEVDEVSLVDRPATGKRFVLFKRGGPFRRSERATTENICSAGDERIEELEKRLADAGAAMNAMRDLAQQLEQRIAAVEGGCAPRQSRDTTQTSAAGLWAGVL